MSKISSLVIEQWLSNFLPGYKWLNRNEGIENLLCGLLRFALFYVSSYCCTFFAHYLSSAVFLHSPGWKKYWHICILGSRRRCNRVWWSGWQPARNAEAPSKVSAVQRLLQKYCIVMKGPLQCSFLYLCKGHFREQCYIKVTAEIFSYKAKDTVEVTLIYGRVSYTVNHIP